MALKRNERYPGRYSNPTTDRPQGAFKNRTAPSAQDGSYLEQDWTNDWDGFFGRLLTVAGIIPNGTVDTALTSQYYDALVKVITNNAGSPPIGIPFYWPNATLPNLVMPEWSGMTFLKWNGSTFSATTFPKLALIIPSLTLVESRGEFIRNWDDGRGVDSGRTLLSAQTSAVPNAKATLGPNGRFWDGGSTAVDGVFSQTARASATVQAAGTSTSTGFDMDLSRASTVYKDGVTEARPRNVAFNFLVRAA